MTPIYLLALIISSERLIPEHLVHFGSKTIVQPMTIVDEGGRRDTFIISPQDLAQGRMTQAQSDAWRRAHGRPAFDFRHALGADRRPDMAFRRPRLSEPACIGNTNPYGLVGDCPVDSATYYTSMLGDPSASNQNTSPQDPQYFANVCSGLNDNQNLLSAPSDYYEYGTATEYEIGTCGGDYYPGDAGNPSLPAMALGKNWLTWGNCSTADWRTAAYVGYANPTSPPKYSWQYGVIGENPQALGYLYELQNCLFGDIGWLTNTPEGRLPRNIEWTFDATDWNTPTVDISAGAAYMTPGATQFSVGIAALAGQIVPDDASYLDVTMNGYLAAAKPLVIPAVALGGGTHVLIDNEHGP